MVGRFVKYQEVPLFEHHFGEHHAVFLTPADLLDTLLLLLAVKEHTSQTVADFRDVAFGVKAAEPVVERTGTFDLVRRILRITSYNVCYTKLLRDARFLC